MGQVPKPRNRPECIQKFSMIEVTLQIIHEKADYLVIRFGTRQLHEKDEV